MTPTGWGRRDGEAWPRVNELRWTRLFSMSSLNTLCNWFVLTLFAHFPPLISCVCLFTQRFASVCLPTGHAAGDDICPPSSQVIPLTANHIQSTSRNFPELLFRSASCYQELDSLTRSIFHTRVCQTLFVFRVVSFKFNRPQKTIHLSYEPWATKLWTVCFVMFS